MFEQRFDEQLDEVNDIASSLKRKITTINVEVNDQNRYMDRMRLELEVTKNNMHTLQGNLDNMIKAIGSNEIIVRSNHVLEHGQTRWHARRTTAFLDIRKSLISVLNYLLD